MKWKWIHRKRKNPARNRSSDWNRHHRVAQRLWLRLNEAIEQKDIRRVDVLMGRLRRVRDIQLQDLGL